MKTKPNAFCSLKTDVRGNTSYVRLVGVRFFTSTFRILALAEIQTGPSIFLAICFNGWAFKHTHTHTHTCIMSLCVPLIYICTFFKETSFRKQRKTLLHLTASSFIFMIHSLVNFQVQWTILLCMNINSSCESKFAGKIFVCVKTPSISTVIKRQRRTNGMRLSSINETTLTMKNEMFGKTLHQGHFVTNTTWTGLGWNSYLRLTAWFIV
jgi:hypothetical protein